MRIATPTITRRILVLRQSGYSLRQIARQVNLNHESVRGYLRQFGANTSQQTRVREKSEARRTLEAVVLRMHHEGYRDGEIAAVIGKHRTTVNKMLTALILGGQRELNQEQLEQQQDIN